MATKTLGSAATTTLTALAYLAGIGNMAPADVAAIAQSIKDDKNVAHPVVPGAFSPNGLLFIPNRGVLQVQPGDFVGVDSTGWPILLSAGAAASASWVHT